MVNLGLWALSIYVVITSTILRDTPVVLRAERAFFRFARSRRRAVLSAFVGALLVRLAAVPIAPMLPPAVHDEFSYLLAGDTFASGRMTNPTHPMWRHFDTFWTLQQPTYMSMYPPGQGLALAVGRVTTGSFAFGVWLSVAAMCAALVWALQGWLPPQWALLGGIIATLRIAVSDYWSQSYWGGAVAAFGGALLIGALPRIARRQRAWDGVIAGAGVVLLANSRPYEGLVLAVVVGAALFLWLVRTTNVKRRRMLRGVAPAMVLVIVAGAGLTMFYFWRVTGRPTVMPYVLFVRQHALPPLFLLQRPVPQISDRNDIVSRFLSDWVAVNYAAARAHPLRNFVTIGTLKLWTYYVGFALLLPFLFLPCVVRDRRVRGLLTAAVAGVASQMFLVLPQAHYMAPFLVAVYGVLLQGLRHLRYGVGLKRWRIALTWSIPLACLIGAWVAIVAQNVRLWAEPTGVRPFAREVFGSDRAAVERKLLALPGDHLVFVHYSPEHNPLNEWVFNRANIDRARIVWARELGAAEDQKLIEYFARRDVWTLEADVRPAQLQLRKAR